MDTNQGVPVKALAQKQPERWFVLEGDWGGQVYASVPVRLVPAWGRRKRVRKALALLNRLNWPGQNDGADVRTYAEFEEFDERAANAAFVEGADPQPLIDATERLAAAEETSERGVLLTYVLPRGQRAWTERDTYLRSWKLVGHVPGGMGGGCLVDGDLWLHSHVLVLGLETANRVRALLGLPPLASLDVAWNEETRDHAAFCRCLNEHTARRRPRRRTRASVRRAA